MFANAALFHVPSQELPRVLLELHACLKAGGVLFSSNPRGQNNEDWNRGRYGVYHDLDAWRRFMSAAGFVSSLDYYRPVWRATRSATLVGERLAQVRVNSQDSEMTEWTVVGRQILLTEHRTLEVEHICDDEATAKELSERSSQRIGS